MINIVLYAPEIPSNTGNIMRTCMASGVHLILIRPLGFKLNDKYLKRSGMDYLKELEYEVFDSFKDFQKVHQGEYYLISRYGKKLYSEVDYSEKENIYLIFGNESSGLSKTILSSYKEKAVRIPMVKQARSLNLANSVAIVIYEVLRQKKFLKLSQKEVIKGENFIDEQ